MIPLSLPLFMLRVGADDAHHTFAVDHLAFITHLFNRSSNLHISLPTSVTGQFFRGLDRGAIIPLSPDLPAASA
jgi:hypothetical protein